MSRRKRCCYRVAAIESPIVRKASERTCCVCRARQLLSPRPPAVGDLTFPWFGIGPQIPWPSFPLPNRTSFFLRLRTAVIRCEAYLSSVGREYCPSMFSFSFFSRRFPFSSPSFFFEGGFLTPATRPGACQTCFFFPLLFFFPRFGFARGPREGTRLTRKAGKSSKQRRIAEAGSFPLSN